MYLMNPLALLKCSAHDSFVYMDVDNDYFDPISQKSNHIEVVRNESKIKVNKVKAVPAP